MTLNQNIRGQDIKIYSSSDFPQELTHLNQIYDSLFSGSKGFRSQLVVQMSEFVSLQANEKKLLAQTIEFIHNSSLLHDDFIDQSDFRRGKTAAWKEFGPEYAVLAGDYLLARVMVNLSKQGHMGLVQLTAETISDLLEGEWLQDNIQLSPSVSFEKMQRIHEKKTASLFSWCLTAPFVYKNYDPCVTNELNEIGRLLGLLLQRSDDLLDFNIRNYENKSTFTDLKAGYMNSFSIFALEDKSTSDIFDICSEKQFTESLGKALIKTKLEAFDQLNQNLIETAIGKAQSLVNLKKINPDFLDLITLTAPTLYWRNFNEYKPSQKLDS